MSNVMRQRVIEGLREGDSLYRNNSSKAFITSQGLKVSLHELKQ
jgi:hypothetical protein